MPGLLERRLPKSSMKRVFIVALLLTFRPIAFGFLVCALLLKESHNKNASSNSVTRCRNNTGPDRREEIERCVCTCVAAREHEEHRIWARLEPDGPEWKSIQSQHSSASPSHPLVSQPTSFSHYLSFSAAFFLFYLSLFLSSLVLTRCLSSWWHHWLPEQFTGLTRITRRRHTMNPEISILLWSLFFLLSHSLSLDPACTWTFKFFRNFLLNNFIGLLVQC